MHLLPVVAVASAFLAPAYVIPYVPTPCTLGSQPTVEARVVDSGGNLQPYATVTFTLDGGPVEQGCIYNGGWPGTGCEWWFGGFDQLGVYTVTAVGPSGTSVTMDVPVTVMDRCNHVETQSVTLVLP